MPTFRVTVELSDLDAPDPKVLRSSIDETLRGAGFKAWRVVNVHDQNGIPTPPNVRPAAVTPWHRDRRGANVGLLLIAGAVIWAIWFFWMLMGNEN